MDKVVREEARARTRGLNWRDFTGREKESFTLKNVREMSEKRK